MVIYAVIISFFPAWQSRCQQSQRHPRAVLGQDTPNASASLFFSSGERKKEGLSFNNWRGFDLGPCPLKLRKKFYDAYKSDEEFEAIDTIICSHPVANCELYMPFNKSMIIYATTRLEFGRYDENVSWRKTSIGKTSLSRWHEWIHNLRLIAENPRNFIAANNLYDAKYIEYYSGIRAKYIPSWCGGDLATLQQHFYRPTRREIVITPYRTNLEYSADKTPRTGWPDVDDDNAKINMLDHEVFTELRNELQRRDAEYGHFEFHAMKSVFPRGYNSMDEFKQFPACVFHTISIFNYVLFPTLQAICSNSCA